MNSNGETVAVSDVLTAETTPASGDKPSERRLRLCLAASGGGHVRQLLDLEGVWSKHDYFFVTEDTALGATLAETHRTHFVPHVALGQARLGAPWRMVRAGVANFFRSASIIARERPDIVISTGAGAVFFAVAWARLRGARTVVIDSFARFDRPSMFARIAAPIANDVVVQSKALGSYFPKAKVFDPFRLLDTPPPPKKPLLFATVGATLPFERLVSSVAELKARGGLPEDVIVQTGVGAPQPQGVTAVETLPFDKIQELLTDADIVVCHGGTGSLITALRKGCRVIAFPRLPEKGEHYDNHQAEITSAFAARGLIEVANDADELAQALQRIKSRPPVLATTDPSELMNYLDEVLDQERRKRRPQTQRA